MTHSAQLSTETGHLMMDHVSGLITHASQLYEQAMELAAAGDRTAAVELHGQAGSLASIAVSFRYDLADAHADTKDADDVIAKLDRWAATLERTGALDNGPRSAVAGSVFNWTTE